MFWTCVFFPLYLTDTSGVDEFFFQHINKTNEKLPVFLKDAHLM